MKTQLWSAAWIVCFLCVCPASAEEADAEARRLGAAVLKAALKVLPAKDDSLREMLPKDIDRRFDEANKKSTADWRKIKTREDWEKFRDEKIGKLRASLNLPTEKVPLNVQVTGEIKEDELEGPGYIVRKIIYDSRPKWQVTANLYLPEKTPDKMPGILLSHSHHSPKTQGELQDMGAMWARAGCAVLVPDHLGHGERRQHPFASAADYPEKFQVGRQDYYFRYNTSIQLYASGESLMGWMAWDLMRGLDVLESLPNIDRERIALMGGVAGGGDPAGVTGALDPRVTLLVPFNFGGPQPETKYPLPENAEETFDYAGGGSWESTRNLHRSAGDGFPHWVIVGSVAPRGLIHAHEFAWDRKHDPVWKRYEKLFDLYGASERLYYTFGFGGVRLSEREASHCGNIGFEHRKNIHWYLGGQNWKLDEKELKMFDAAGGRRHTAAELACLKEGAKLTPLRELLPSQPGKRTWKEVLGNVEPYAVRAESLQREEIQGIVAEQFLLSGERDLRVPALLITEDKGKRPVTICLVDQANPDDLLEQADAFGKSFKNSALCLVNVRGTGLSSVRDDHSRKSYNTSLAASELMLGEPLLAGQLRDLRSVIAWLRTKKEFSGIELHADGIGSERLEPANDKDHWPPLELAQPQSANIVAPTLALLACYFEDERMKAHVRGGLVSYRSLLESQFVHVPLDAIIPGAIPAGDVEELIRVGKMKHDLTVVEQVNARNQLISK